MNKIEEKKKNNIYYSKIKKNEGKTCVNVENSIKKIKKIFISDIFKQCRDSGRYRISRNILENKAQVRVRDVFRRNFSHFCQKKLKLQ